MRTLILLITLLTSFQVFASDLSCKVTSIRSRVILSLEKEIELKKSHLVMDKAECTMTQHPSYTDICSIGEHTIMVSSNHLPSLLVTKKGKVHKLKCSTGPEQRQQQQQQQQQQQEQQEQQDDEPGHGGNTAGTGGNN